MNDVEERPTWVDGLAETLVKLADAIDELNEQLVSLWLEVEVMFGRVPGNLGTIIRLPFSERWAVAGTWLPTDDDVNLPKGIWGHLLSRMVRDVRAGRLLADPGF